MDTELYRTYIYFYLLRQENHDYLHFYNSIKDLVDRKRYDDSVDYLFLCIKTVLQEASLFPSTFLTSGLWEEFIYEMTFDIYRIIDAFLKRNEKGTISDKCKTYNDFYGLSQESISLEKDLSEGKRDLKKDHLSLTIMGQRNKKVATYIATLNDNIRCINKDFKDTTQVRLPDLDYVFNIKYYHKFIYSVSQQQKGILVSNYYKLIEKEFSKKGESPSFFNEYSFYLLEYLHYPIQYFNCVCSYCELFRDEGINKQVFPLFLFTKLFDHHYKSITKFIIGEFKQDLKEIYDRNTSSKIIHIVFTSQQMVDYWCPIIKYTLLSIIVNQYHPDLIKVRTILEEYIEQHLDQQYTYINELRNSMTRIKNTKYPKKNSNKETGILETVRKHDIKNSFIYAVSKLFYLEEFPSFFSRYPYSINENTNDSLRLDCNIFNKDDFKKFFGQYYYNRERQYRDSMIKEIV